MLNMPWVLEDLRLKLNQVTHASQPCHFGLNTEELKRISRNEPTFLEKMKKHETDLLFCGVCQKIMAQPVLLRCLTSCCRECCKEHCASLADVQRLLKDIQSRSIYVEQVAILLKQANTYCTNLLASVASGDVSILEKEALVVTQLNWLLRETGSISTSSSSHGDRKEGVRHDDQSTNRFEGKPDCNTDTQLSLTWTLSKSGLIETGSFQLTDGEELMKQLDGLKSELAEACKQFQKARKDPGRSMAKAVSQAEVSSTLDSCHVSTKSNCPVDKDSFRKALCAIPNMLTASQVREIANALFCSDWIIPGDLQEITHTDLTRTQMGYKLVDTLSTKPDDCIKKFYEILTSKDVGASNVAAALCKIPTHCKNPIHSVTKT